MSSRITVVLVSTTLVIVSVYYCTIDLCTILYTSRTLIGCITEIKSVYLKYNTAVVQWHNIYW